MMEGKGYIRILFTGSLHPAYELKIFRDLINKIKNVKCALTLWISANRALNNYAQYVIQWFALYPQVLYLLFFLSVWLFILIYHVVN